jgi:23S rRNA pseudouridine1911/1915/1917 synthase
MHPLIIDEKLTNIRLDKLLVEKFPKQSRSELQKMIDAGAMTINCHPAKAHDKLKIGDTIEFVSPSKRVSAVANSSRPRVVHQKADKSKLKIIAQTDDYVVINKPAGLLVHDNTWPPRRPTVAEFLVKKYPEILLVGENPTRPGIVHRLDKDVSGLMVVPRTKAMFDSLKRQFQHRTVKKYYTALVYGVIAKPEGVINLNLGRSSDGHKMAARPLNQAGKVAITEYEVIRQWQNYSLLKVCIKTGRTHQIRAHLAAFDHPLVGDDWYGTNKTKLKNKGLVLNRVFLVASELSFLDLQKVRQRFSIRLPQQLTDFLKEIK